MKKYSILALVFVLTATVFAGCRRNNASDKNTMPSILPTTQATTEMTTEATTRPSQPTTPSNQETIEDGNGPLTTDSTENTNANNGGNGGGVKGNSGQAGTSGQAGNSGSGAVG